MNDKRKYKRQTHKENAYVEIVVQQGQQDFVQKIIPCETVDLSEDGLKMYMSEPVQQGLITDLIIELGEPKERYRLTAEVKWISSTADDGWYFAGFQLFDAEDTHYGQWVKMVSRCSHSLDQ